MPEKEPLIPRHGGYRNLKSFQVAQLVYDVTVRFCDRYIAKRSRTHDQMVQAARSGVQNIAEGSQAAGTSKKTELKLTNVARASLEELRLDYEDFLRQRGLPFWERNDAQRESLIARRCKTADCVAQWVREQSGLGGLSGLSGQEANSKTTEEESSRALSESRAFKQGKQPLKENSSVPPTLSTKSTPSTQSTPSTFPELAANAALVLIAVACSLLDRQLISLAAVFEHEGGFTERLYRVRTRARGAGR
jgi:four helix bundle suffix protein